MGAQRTSFEKLQRDRAKKAKAANKREKRQGRAETDPDEPAVSTDAEALLADDGHELTAGELLALVEELHRRYDAKEIEFEEFEERKIELLQRLPVD
ncbi:hypothetical protein [Rhabdothermincola salaria]|uniref:hypothetical protein n=1 Tax=Rhabdothermincola salaria TaxID=2903142 RepID=UPI001E3595DB|nr:hypothetical protein [Rhabdothermincola salaria]MCD9622973.1 hypothetical protein [Rhabdothermincola salaria]